MRIISTKSDGTLKISLEGELDHHAAKSAIMRIRELIDAELPCSVVLNFKSLGFMDSSGIALIMHTHRQITSLAGTLYLEDVPSQCYKVLSAAGIHKIIPIAKKEAKR